MSEVADGERFLSNTVDILWYIDGHYATFNDRNRKIPVTFSRFTGYTEKDK